MTSFLLMLMLLATLTYRPSRTTAANPQQPPVKMRKVNCFSGPGALRGDHKTFPDTASPLVCANFCLAARNNFTLVGVTQGQECYCGHTIEIPNRAKGCHLPCAGDTSQTCGGLDGKMEVYMIADGCPLFVVHRATHFSRCRVIERLISVNTASCLYNAHTGVHASGNVVNLRASPDQFGFACDIRECRVKKSGGKGSLPKEKDLLLENVKDGDGIKTNVYVRKCTGMQSSGFVQFEMAKEVTATSPAPAPRPPPPAAPAPRAARAQPPAAALPPAQAPTTTMAPIPAAKVVIVNGQVPRPIAETTTLISSDKIVNDVQLYLQQRKALIIQVSSIVGVTFVITLLCFICCCYKYCRKQECDDSDDRKPLLRKGGSLTSATTRTSTQFRTDTGVTTD